MIINSGKEFTIDKDTEGMSLKLSSKPYYIFKGDIEAWLDKDPKQWQERKLYFDTDYPVQVQGSLRARSYIHTNYPLIVKGEDLRGEF